MSRGPGLPRLRDAKPVRMDLSQVDILVLALYEALMEDAPIEKLRAVLSYCAETQLEAADVNEYGPSPANPACWRR